MKWKNIKLELQFFKDHPDSPRRKTNNVVLPVRADRPVQGLKTEKWTQSQNREHDSAWEHCCLISDHINPSGLAACCPLPLFLHFKTTASGCNILNFIISSIIPLYYNLDLLLFWPSFLLHHWKSYTTISPKACQPHFWDTRQITLLFQTHLAMLPACLPAQFPITCALRT